MAVLVTGSTGFIAQYIIKGLLDQDYQVIGTVRNENKREFLLTNFEHNPKLSLEIVPDIAKLDAFDQVIEKRSSEIEYILHTASPVKMSAEDPENEILIPALNGTKAILNAAKIYSKDIKRIVITSSVAAFLTPGDKTRVVDETCWNPITWEQAKQGGFLSYIGSKAFAEKAAWEFVENNKDNISFDLVTTAPFFVFGPELFESNLKISPFGASNSIIGNYFRPEIDPKDDSVITSFTDNGFVDVRDVAKAHILAMQRKEFHGKRVLLFGGPCNGQDIVDILIKNIPQLKDKLPVGKPGTGPWYTKDSQPGRINDSKSKELLGFEFAPLEKSVTDVATQFLEFVSKK